ncbi:hypothetical protein [Solobacterium sp.]|uniref:hypothetical protein n=1 Tax=Solobacterium sp. TaxID=2060878 RepID=UPI001CADC00C|nr:hypothetical protein [Solobacterium sp.]MBF1085987.1 hypothetical protein [Solobacterium sp.]
MKNKDKYNLAHLHIVERPGKTRLDYCFKYVEIEYGGRIIKEYSCLDVEVSKKFFEWLEEDDEKEYKPQILTEKEKAYLSAVIKPFRKDIEYIEKRVFISNPLHSEYIRIYFKYNETLLLPNFPRGTMYKGMELNEEYTLEELGL